MIPMIAKRLLDAEFNADTAVAANLKQLGLLESLHTIRWSAGVTSGAVVIEAAETPDYTGTWDLVVPAVAFTGTAPNTNTVRVPGSYPVLRHRISTIVEGGTVTSRIDGNG